MIKNIPQKSKIDELNREISELTEQLEEKSLSNVSELTQIKQLKQESDHELKSIQSELIQAQSEVSLAQNSTILYQNQIEQLTSQMVAQRENLAKAESHVYQVNSQQDLQVREIQMLKN